MDYSLISLSCASSIAFFVGILTGVFGVGGGFLMTPALMMFLSVPGPVAVGTDLAVILGNSSLGLYARRRTRTVDFKLAGTISCGNIIGVLFGSHLLQLLQVMKPITVWGKEHNAVELVLYLLFCLLLIWVSFYVAYDYRRSTRQDSQDIVSFLSRLKVPPYVQYPSVTHGTLSVPALLVLGAVIGCLTGLLGIGGGVVLLPALVYLVGQDIKEAAGTSLVLVWIASLVGVVHKGYAGHISIPLWVALALGGLTGTYVGTKVGLETNKLKLKVYFLYVVILALLVIVVRLFQLLFY